MRQRLVYDLGCDVTTAAAARAVTRHTAYYSELTAWEQMAGLEAPEPGDAPLSGPAFALISMKCLSLPLPESVTSDLKRAPEASLQL